MAKLKAGDVVTLKSGGPRMTVEGKETVPSLVRPLGVECSWFVQGAHRRASFPAETLELYEAPPPPPPLHLSDLAPAGPTEPEKRPTTAN